MPLPERNAVWPPEWWVEEQKLINRSRRWLVGDVGGIDPATVAEPAVKRRLLRRKDTTSTTATPRHTQHVPLPRLIAQTAASLLFSESPSWVIPEAHEDRGVNDKGEELPPSAAQTKAIDTEDHLSRMARDDGWQAKLHQSAYVSSGLGGVYLRPLWGTDRTRPTLTIVHHDHAVPVFDFDALVEVTFWRTVETMPNGHELVHLECHTAGQVQHGLYTLSLGKLTAVDLTSHRSTKGLAVDRDGILDVRPIIGAEMLPDYVPNMLPHPVTLSDVIGGADTAGLDDRLAALDEAATAWSADVRLGKPKLLIADQFLSRSGQGNGATYDPDREIYSPITMGALEAEGSKGWEMIQSEVRSEAFQASKGDLMNEISLAAGYNPESIEWTATGQAATATEVLSRDAKSQDTTEAKQGYYAPGMAAAAYKMLQVDRVFYRAPIEPMMPTVEWPATKEEDLRELATTLNLLNLSGAVSPETKVRILHKDWTDAEVLAEVDKISEADAQPVADPTGFMS